MNGVPYVWIKPTNRATGGSSTRHKILSHAPPGRVYNDTLGTPLDEVVNNFSDYFPHLRTRYMAYCITVWPQYVCLPLYRNDFDLFIHRSIFYFFPCLMRLRSDIYGCHSLLTIHTLIQLFNSPYPCFIPCTFGLCFIPNLLFLRYICSAATCNVGKHKLFTVCLILLSLFMYRISPELKADQSCTFVCVSFPTCYFWRYICFAATCNVVNHELLTVR